MHYPRQEFTGPRGKPNNVETTTESQENEHPVPLHAVERAVKLSYVQAMLGAVYAASVGGMFLIGYALKLGATNAQIGLMSTIPMYLIVVQLASAALVENGRSRKRMTIIGALLNVCGWGFVAALPVLTRGAPANVKMNTLIGLISAITLFAYVSSNARGSWIGDLIPAGRLGGFFGKLMMYAGIIGTGFALIEGRFLDVVKHAGIEGFSWLFMFGMLFGLANVAMFLPQADVKLAIEGARKSFLSLIAETFANRAMMITMAYGTAWSLQAIAGPFYATYLLRDLDMPFLGVGILNAAVTVTMLLSAPFWGRMVDRYGCRPVLTVCTLACAPSFAAWFFVKSALAVYCVILPINLLQGFWTSGVSVSLNTLIYKITPSVGRSVQFAVYSIIVMWLAAPMPAIGGHLPGWLKAAGIHADLRATFLACMPFVLIAALISRKIGEEGARSTKDVVQHLSRRKGA